MKRALLLIVVMGMSSVAKALTLSGWEHAGNPDRFPSVGMTFSRISMTGDYAAHPAYTSWNYPNGNRFDQNNVIFDARFPVSDYLTWTFGGGYSRLNLETRDNTMIVCMGGAAICDYNIPVSSQLDGYNVSIGLRWYIH